MVDAGLVVEKEVREVVGVLERRNGYPARRLQSDVLMREKPEVEL